MHELEGYDHHEYMKSFFGHAIVPVSIGSSEPLPQEAEYLYSTDKGLYRQAEQAFTGRVRFKLWRRGEAIWTFSVGSL